MVGNKIRPRTVRFRALAGWIFLLVTTRPALLLACGAGVLVLGVAAFLGVAKAGRRWPFDWQ